MKQEVDPRESTRAQAFDLWMTSPMPMPMLTLTRTFDVTRVRKMAGKKGWKFSMLMCWYCESGFYSIFCGRRPVSPMKFSTFAVRFLQKYHI